MKSLISWVTEIPLLLSCFLTTFYVNVRWCVLSLFLWPHGLRNLLKQLSDLVLVNAWMPKDSGDYHDSNWQIWPEGKLAVTEGTKQPQRMNLSILFWSSCAQKNFAELWVFSSDSLLPPSFTLSFWELCHWAVSNLLVLIRRLKGHWCITEMRRKP